MRLLGGRLKRSESALEPGTVFAGRYRVLDEIGRGGMGIVYRVQHIHTGEWLALKLLVGAAKSDSLALKRFKREGETSARLQSEHVVRILDADVSSELDGSPFLVMELLTGSNVETYAKAIGPLEPSALLSLLAQIGPVLETAHALGIVHRDLKPENLFLHRRKDGSTIVKLLDFGISKFSRESQLDTAKTATGSVIGTPLYMSPEQAHGRNDEIGATTDVWALGLVAMRLLAGEHYWGAPTMADLMMKIAVLPIQPPSQRWPTARHMSPELDAWFLRSCDRDPSKRWSSVDVQLRELASALRTEMPSPNAPLMLSPAVSATEAADVDGQTLSTATTPAPAVRSRALAAGLAAGAACAVLLVVTRGVSPTDASSQEMPTTMSDPSASSEPITTPPLPIPAATPVAPAVTAAGSVRVPAPRLPAPKRVIAPTAPSALASTPTPTPLYAPLAP